MFSKERIITTLMFILFEVIIVKMVIRISRSPVCHIEKFFEHIALHPNKSIWIVLFCAGYHWGKGYIFFMLVSTSLVECI